MSTIIRTYGVNYGERKQAISMVRRARVISVYAQGENIALDAEVLEDNDTRAFDVDYQRFFQVVASGRERPAEGVYVGSVTLPVVKLPHKKTETVAFHVYEVKGGR